MTDEEIRARATQAMRNAMYAMADAEAGSVPRMAAVECPDGVRAMVGMMLVMSSDGAVALRSFGHAGNAAMAALHEFAEAFAPIWAQDLPGGGPCMCGKCGRP